MCTAITHTCPQATYKLPYNFLNPSLVWYKPLHSFRYSFFSSILEQLLNFIILVRLSQFPIQGCGERGHSPCKLIPDTVSEHNRARTLLSTCKKSSNHDGRCPCCYSFCYISRKPDASISNYRYIII